MVFWVPVSLMKTGIDFQSIHSILKITEDDADGAAQSMEYLMSLSSRLGVDMVDLADQYAKMNLSRGKLSKQTVQDVVTGMQEYGTALHLDRNRMSLANFGLQQVRQGSPTSAGIEPTNRGIHARGQTSILEGMAGRYRQC